MPIRTKLTYKQSAFAKAYVQENGNATEAALKAGYKVKNRQTAAAVGRETLQSPLVQAEIEHWSQRLERQIAPSLQVIEELRDKCEDPRIRLAAGRDLLNRAGVGKQAAAKTNVLAVFANMDEGALLEKMAQLAGQNEAKDSENNK